MKLYHCAGSRSVRIRWLLEELGVDYELHEMPFSIDALQSEDYLKVNPLGRVPTFIDGGLVMHESVAIAQYILETCADGRLQPPRGTPERGRFLDWMHYAEASLMVPMATLIRQLVFTPEGKRDDVALAAAREKYAQLIEPVESALADRDYLLGEFSAADCMLGYTVFLSAYVRVLDDTTPNVQGYFARCRARPAWERAMQSTLDQG